jgi:hypothetical protein
MQEAGATARVTGYCALTACAPITGALPAAAERLSDHCPVVVEIQDRDMEWRKTGKCMAGSHAPQCPRPQEGQWEGA